MRPSSGTVWRNPRLRYNPCPPTSLKGNPWKNSTACWPYCLHYRCSLLWPTPPTVRCSTTPCWLPTATISMDTAAADKSANAGTEPTLPPFCGPAKRRTPHFQQMATDIVIAHHRRAQYPQRGGRPLPAGANLRTGGLAAEQRLHCPGAIRADRKTVCCRQTVRRFLLPLYARQRSRFATLPRRWKFFRPMQNHRHGQTVNGKPNKKAACTLQNKVQAAFLDETQATWESSPTFEKFFL